MPFRFFVSSLRTSIRKEKHSYAISVFDGVSNNILKSLDYLDYIDKFDGNSEEKLTYIYNLKNYILDANQTVKLTNKLHLLVLEKNSLLNLNENEILLLKLIGIERRCFNIEFSNSFSDLDKILPLKKDAS